MSWKEILIARPRSTSRVPRVTVSLSLMGRQKFQILYININTMMMEMLNWSVGSLATIEMGEGEDFGKLKITNNPNGAYLFGRNTGGNKNAKYFSSRLLVGLPDNLKKRENIKQLIAEYEIV